MFYINQLKKSLISGLIFIASGISAAAGWSKTSVLLLDGAGYKEVADDSRYNTQVLTLEHVSGWKYGSNFFFVDATRPNRSTTEFYGEFSPSLSFGKMTGKDFSLGIVKDVSLTGTWEVGQNTNAKLFGLGFDIDIPNMPVATVNVYQRQSESTFFPGKIGNGQQITLVWMTPFSLGLTQWVFDGFLDYATAEKEVGKEENIVSSPRLMMDAGALFGGLSKTVYVGMEYSYWKNKYGVKGVDESVPQLALQWTF